MRYTATLEINIVAPFLSRTLAASKLGVDAACQKRDEKWALPGTHVKGQLREAFEVFMRHGGQKQLNTIVDSRYLVWRFIRKRLFA